MSRGHVSRNEELVQQEIADGAVSGGGHEFVASRDRPSPSRGHDLGRFRWAIVALFVLAACSLGAAVLLTTGRRQHPGGGQLAGGQAWSSWQPTYGGLTGAQEIADYLAPNYRATPASQLAVVTVVNLNDPAAPVQVVGGLSIAQAKSLAKAGLRAFVISGNMGLPDGNARYNLPPAEIQRLVAGRRREQGVKGGRVLRAELEPGQEVEGLAEVSPMMQTAGDRREVLEAGRDVPRALLEDHQIEDASVHAGAGRNPRAGPAG